MFSIGIYLYPIPVGIMYIRVQENIFGLSLVLRYLGLTILYVCVLQVFFVTDTQISHQCEI